MLPSGLSSNASEAQRQASSFASSLSQSARSIITGQEPEEADPLDSCFPEVSYETRLYGFIGCAISGFCVSLLGTVFLSFGMVASFAILYSVGNLIAMLSTMFLVGFKKQIKSMCDPTRIIATVVFLAALCLTLVVAIKKENVFFVILFIIIQWLAGAWYMASYVPFARDAIKSCCKSGVGV